MFEKLYYEDLRRETIANIDKAITDGILPVEDKQKTIDYYEQWLNCPIWSMVEHEGKTYYRNKGIRRETIAFVIFMSIFAIFLIAMLVVVLAASIGII